MAQNHKPLKIETKHSAYIINFGKFNIAEIYDSGPIKIITNKIIETTIAKLAIRMNRRRMTHQNHNRHFLRMKNYSHHMVSNLPNLPLLQNNRFLLLKH